MTNYLNYIIIAVLALFIVFRLVKNKNSQSQVTKLIQQGKALFLVDVRQPEEFKQGSAKGAINIPLGQIQNRIKELKGKENIVVFCKSGMRAGQAVSILKQNGITGVINGGSWQNVAKAAH